MIRKIKLILGFLAPLSLLAQDHQSKFNECLSKQDTVCQRETLEKWESSEPDNAELFTSYFNYHFMKARKEMVVLSPQPMSADALELRDSNGQVSGYLGSEITYDEIETQKGIARINEGIQLYPNRLDMHFGKIYVYGILKDWENFTNSIIQSIELSSINNNEWTWTNNIPKEKGKEFFLSSMQDYQLQLYNTNDDSLLNNMAEIAKTILYYYPEHIESMSNLSICYLLLGKVDQGLEVLLHAEQVDPQDDIVLSNIAHAYVLKGDKKMAIEYYEKTIKYGDSETQAFAKAKIKELKGK